jgi:hypothetical protein
MPLLSAGELRQFAPPTGYATPGHADLLLVRGRVLTEGRVAGLDSLVHLIG